MSTNDSGPSQPPVHEVAIVSGEAPVPLAAVPEPPPGVAESTAVARNSLAVAMWSVVSRVTGVAKVVVIAAVLGGTYLGNTYQATNSMPNIVYYDILAGALFASLLVPVLVRHVDLGDDRVSERMAGGFLGIVMLISGLIGLVAVLLGPFILRLLALGVEDPGIAQAQRQVGWPLLAMFMPQVFLYAVAGTGSAVMNAHGRFALAAAAPALENVGILAVLGLTAVLFGTGTNVTEVEPPQLLLLGLGTTAAVGLHATAQWWGARRAGVVLVPRAGWHDEELRQVIRRMVPSLGFAALSALRFFAILVVANRVPGGVVAFQLALNFFFLPIAIGTWPVALALLPQLSRAFEQGDRQLFRDELVKGVRLSFFFTIPAAVAYFGLAYPLARAVAFGEMKGEGIALIALSLAALAIGLLGESGFILATNGCYAQQNARSPFTSMVARTGVAVGGMLIAFFLHGNAVVVALGLSLSLGNLLGGWHLARSLKRTLPQGGERIIPPLLRTAVASALMVGPAYLTAAFIQRHFSGHLSEVMAMLAASVVGAALFLVQQLAWKAPELTWLRGGASKLRPSGRS